MIYYKSRYLSERLNINLAKWKRWSRDFLEPDPLGGLQSGVARQFSSRDAFKVYLGGCLVSDLRFSIPEAQMIIKDLSPWLKRNKFFSIKLQLLQPGQRTIPEHRIYIYKMSKHNFAYGVRTIFSALVDRSTDKAITESFTVSFLGTDSDPLALANGVCSSATVLAITTLYEAFRRKIS